MLLVHGKISTLRMLWVPLDKALKHDPSLREHAALNAIITLSFNVRILVS